MTMIIQGSRCGKVTFLFNLKKTLYTLMHGHANGEVGAVRLYCLTKERAQKIYSVFFLILSITGKISFQTGKGILLPVEFLRIPSNFKR